MVDIKFSAMGWRIKMPNCSFYFELVKYIFVKVMKNRSFFRLCSHKNWSLFIDYKNDRGIHFLEMKEILEPI